MSSAHALITNSNTIGYLSQQTDDSISTTLPSPSPSPTIVNHHHQGRWSPTSEQLMALEELYRHGTRTPTPPQIQQITANLRRFGKIEGKNVFYWFQNHKARDKKKKKKKQTQSSEMLGSEGARMTSLQVEQTKREPLSNCNTNSQESASATRTSTSTTQEMNKYYHYYSSSLEEMPFYFPIINNATTVVNPFCLGQSLLKREPIFQQFNTHNTTETLELFPLRSGDTKTSLTFGAGKGNCGFIKSDLSLSLLLSMEK